MSRGVIVALIIALAPALASAQGYEEHHPGGPPPPGMRGPHPGGPHPGGPPPGHFMFRGHPFNPFHAEPFIYPHGWAYRRWAVGAILPPLFLAPTYYYSNYAALGLPPPEPGFQWVRYGSDLLLVNVATGQVAEVVPNAFY
jgi:Nickel/cobalt transporter regulator